MRICFISNICSCFCQKPHVCSSHHLVCDYTITAVTIFPQANINFNRKNMVFLSLSLYPSLLPIIYMYVYLLKMSHAMYIIHIKSCIYLIPNMYTNHPSIILPFGRTCHGTALPRGKTSEKTPPSVSTPKVNGVTSMSMMSFTYQNPPVEISLRQRTHQQTQWQEKQTCHSKWWHEFYKDIWTYICIISFNDFSTFYLD